MTRPPRRMPCAQWGRGTSGSVTRMCVPGIGEPRTTAKTSRMSEHGEAELDEGRRRSGPRARRSGGRPPRSPATAMRRARRRGLVVRVAAVPRASAHSHQAPGCSRASPGGAHRGAGSRAGAPAVRRSAHGIPAPPRLPDRRPRPAPPTTPMPGDQAEGRAVVRRPSCFPDAGCLGCRRSSRPPATCSPQPVAGYPAIAHSRASVS